MKSTASIHVDDLRDLQRLLASLVKECRIDIEADGWHIQAVDVAHVACLDIHMGREIFASYEMEPTTIQLDIERLGQILKQAPRAGHISLTLGDRTITWSDGHSMRWRQRLEDVDNTPIRIPELTYQAHCWVDKADLIRAGRMAAMIDETIRLTLDDRTLRLSASNNAEDAVMTVPDSEAHGRARVLLPLDYWQSAVQAIPQNGSEIRLDLGDDKPVKLSIDGDGLLNGLYMIAPRIEEDDA